MKQVGEYRSFMFYLIKFQEDIIYEIKKRKVDATLKKVFKGSDETSHRSSLVAIKDVFVIVCFTVLCVSVGTVFVVLCFILLVMKVFFNSLIIWKQSNSFLDLIDYRSAHYASGKRTFRFNCRLAVPKHRRVSDSLVAAASAVSF